MSNETKRAAIVLAPGQGRSYSMGPMKAVFKADGDETARMYTISEWWLEPHSRGPGAHSHAEDDTFYVVQGTMSFFSELKRRNVYKIAAAYVVGSWLLLPARGNAPLDALQRLQKGALEKVQ